MVKIGTLNVGSMTGRGHELVDLMERRKVKIMCLQETKWKGSKSKRAGKWIQAVLCWRRRKEKWGWHCLE